MNIEPTFCQRNTTSITVIRKGSKGLDGTIENANHHAQPALPLVELMSKIIPSLGFREWKQGHNVHVLETADGRQYAFRPLVYTSGQSNSWGLRMLLRYSRTVEIPLMDIKTTEDVLNVCSFLRATTDLCINRYTSQAKDFQPQTV